MGAWKPLGAWLVPAMSLYHGLRIPRRIQGPSQPNPTAGLVVQRQRMWLWPHLPILLWDFRKNPAEGQASSILLAGTLGFLPPPPAHIVFLSQELLHVELGQENEERGSVSVACVSDLLGMSICLCWLRAWQCAVGRVCVCFRRYVCPLSVSV